LPFAVCKKLNNCVACNHYIQHIIKCKMKLFFIALVLQCSVTSLLNAQALGTDASGKSVLVSEGGAAGVDFQRAVFNANYTFFSNSDYSKTTPFVGFNLSGGNRAGITDALKNGITARSIDLRLHAGFAVSNEYKAKYKGITQYTLFLKDERSKIEQEMAAIASDSSYVSKAKLLFYGKYAAYADSVIKIYKWYFPNADDIKTHLMLLVKRFDFADALDFEYTLRQYIASTKGNAHGYTARKAKLAVLNEQLADTGRLPKTFIRTSVFVSGGFKSFQFNEISFLKKSATDSSLVVTNTPHQQGQTMMGVNHQFGPNWFLGYGFAIETHDNFEYLQRLNVDSTWAYGTQKMLTKSYTGYWGKYFSQTSVPFLFQLTYAGAVKNLGTVIFTPLYASLGLRKQYGTSLSLLMKNRLCLGLNIEQLVLSKKLSRAANDQKYLSFGFQLRYVLADFDL
jgi:hypothetical protein